MRKHLGTAWKTGFSLIEVTLAIGVVSFAALSILGTMSVGLTTIHDAKKDMMHAQIIAQVASTVSQTPFEEMESFASSGPYYFDQGGRQLTSSNGSLYSATLVVTAANSTTYPGATSSLDSSAKSVQITVSKIEPGTSIILTSSRAVLLVPKS